MRCKRWKKKRVHSFNAGDQNAERCEAIDQMSTALLLAMHLLCSSVVSFSPCHVPSRLNPEISIVPECPPGTVEATVLKCGSWYIDVGPRLNSDPQPQPRHPSSTTALRPYRVVLAVPVRQPPRRRPTPRNTAAAPARLLLPRRSRGSSASGNADTRPHVWTRRARCKTRPVNTRNAARELR